MSNPTTTYDVVIVGAGISGAMIAKQLGLAGKKVLILESGEGLPPNVNNFMQRFYLSTAKVPESPYPPELFNPPGSNQLTDPSTQNAARASVLSLNADTWKNPKISYLIQDGPNAFGSTYERVAGGTMRHWLGTSLRFVPNDFKTKTAYNQMVDWPISYDDLEPWYCKAEAEIGVSANAADQAYLGITFQPNYNYPMKAIPPSLVDEAVAKGVEGMTFDGLSVTVTGTPAGRNSQPYQGRRVCAGNTNCIPICPIQAKYDPSVTLNAALNTGNVTLWAQTVASNIVLDSNNQVSQIDYIQYEKADGPATAKGSVRAAIFVLAAHAIETPRLLLMSTNNGRTPKGVANSSGQVGLNLMDHPLYLAWGLAPKGAPVFGFRGPLATSGIESLRDGAFRSQRAAFRIEIGNEGWNFSDNDPYTTTLDLINGMNASQLNPAPSDASAPPALWGSALTDSLNDALSRQFRLGFLVEQSPDGDKCKVSLSDVKDNLGLPRPKINYELSQYTKQGIIAAKQAADEIFARMNVKQYTTTPEANDPTSFEATIAGESIRLKYYGSGHIVGTYCMGDDPKSSVLNPQQRSWDHANLYMVGSGVFPTVATANPTLTLTALALQAADNILHALQ